MVPNEAKNVGEEFHFMSSTFALRATVDTLRLACHPKLREAERRVVPEVGLEPTTPRL